MSIHMSPTIGELAKALAAAQAELEPAKRDATNPHFRSKYADLSACWDAVRAPLARHGLAVSQLPSLDGDVVRLTTMLLHTSGEFIGSDAAVRIAKHDAPSVGSALTYLRRYSLSAIVGLSSVEDDDGVAAMAPATPPRQQPAAQPSQELRTAAAQVERAFPGAQTTYVATQQPDGEPSCPQCGGRMWDNRGTPSKPKTNPKAPDYKCRDKECSGVIWPPRGARKQERVEAVPMPDGPTPDLDDMPF